MTRFLKQIVSLALCLFFVMAPQSLAISKTNANDTELIYEFMETWDDGDYVANAALNVSDYQTIALDYLTDEFVRSKQGLCVVESIDLTSVRIIKELTDSSFVTTIVIQQLPVITMYLRVISLYAHHLIIRLTVIIVPSIW